MEPYIYKPERLGYFVEQKGKVEQSYLKSLVGFTDKPVILYLQRSLPLCVTSIHSDRIRGRRLVPRPGNAVPIRGSGSKRVSVPFKIGSRPGLRGVAAPLLADLIGIRRLRVWFLLDNEPSTCTMV